MEFLIEYQFDIKDMINCTNIKINVFVLNYLLYFIFYYDKLKLNQTMTNIV